MIDHLTVTVGDLRRSCTFYDAALEPLGLRRVVDYVDPEDDEAGVEAVGYGAERGAPVLWLVTGPASTANVHVAFAAADREAVDRFYAAGLAAGGRAAQPPRRWEIYRPGYYGALVSDPDANLIEGLVLTDRPGQSTSS